MKEVTKSEVGSENMNGGIQGEEVVRDETRKINKSEVSTSSRYRCAT